jgi:hypothetical protein
MLKPMCPPLEWHRSSRCSAGRPPVRPAGRRAARRPCRPTGSVNSRHAPRCRRRATPPTAGTTSTRIASRPLEPEPDTDVRPFNRVDRRRG